MNNEDSKTYKLSSKDFWYQIKADFDNKGGVYKLFCLDDNDNIINVNRLLKTDLNGVLYIGKATCFLDRVICLKKSISPDFSSSSHECGVRYKKSYLIKEKFPFEGLSVELVLLRGY